MVTTACNTNCIYCYAKRNSVISLPLQKIENIIDECHNIGVSNIALTGGDIFAGKDWKELLAYTTYKGYCPFLSTKTPLTDDDIAFLKGIGINKPDFILGNVYNNPLKAIWNSPKALDICTSYQIDKRETGSPCKHCKVLDICRKSIDRRICFVDISKTMGKGYFDYPDPRCPQSTITGYIL